LNWFTYSVALSAVVGHSRALELSTRTGYSSAHGALVWDCWFTPWFWYSQAGWFTPPVWRALRKWFARRLWCFSSRMAHSLVVVLAVV